MDRHEDAADRERVFAAADPVGLVAAGHWAAGGRAMELGVMGPIGEGSAVGGDAALRRHAGDRADRQRRWP